MVFAIIMLEIRFDNFQQETESSGQGVLDGKSG